MVRKHSRPRRLGRNPSIAKAERIREAFFALQKKTAKAELFPLSYVGVTPRSERMPPRRMPTGAIVRGRDQTGQLVEFWLSRATFHEMAALFYSDPTFFGFPKVQ